MTSSPESTDVFGCDLRGGGAADRFNCFRSTDKPGSMGSNSLTKVVAVKWKLIEPQPMERKLA
jgi:hypothetical protein